MFKEMTLDECFKKGLLRKANLPKEAIKKEVELAEGALNEAESLSQSQHLNAAVIFIYTAMFHATRALLFRDGYSEKSHACLVIYLAEKYVKTGKLEQKFIWQMDNLRAERHQALYDMPKVYESEEVAELINQTGRFLEIIKETLQL